jgi:hypothetical protein
MFLEEIFVLIREIVNENGNVRTLDSALLEVARCSEKILRQYQVTLAFDRGGGLGTRVLTILTLCEDVDGENSTDSSVFTGHQTKNSSE